MKHSDLPDTSLISPTHSGEIKHTTSSALIQSLIRMTCTGEEGEKMSYYKETFMAIDTVLIPSINIISQEIFNVDMDTCRVAYKVFNEGNMTLNVQSSDSVVSLKPMQSEWAHCSITKCDSTASLEECKQTIRRNSQLDWFSAERQKVGLVSFERLHWSDLELDKVRRRPFSVSGQVTKNSCSRYLVGEPIKFLYKISNISGIEYENVTFKIVVLKEVAASRVEVQENSSFIHIGQSSHLGLNFNSGECLELEHVMMLLYSGQFIVECHCVTNGKPILNIDSGIAIHVT
ncbi:TRAPPC9 [Bugula neritina]|uniref:TRAPPC9 n=1 Tax=Bugula neritina TaxID=10212 RepID=A0A7J7JH69_BUGNE|nr:TRAPPC9 [Bugula neritina]